MIYFYGIIGEKIVENVKIAGKFPGKKTYLITGSNPDLQIPY